MKYYILVIRTLYKNMPDDVYTDDHLVFNDIDALNAAVEKMSGMVMLKPVRIEEGAFKNGRLKCKKILRDFIAEEKHIEDDE